MKFSFVGIAVKIIRYAMPAIQGTPYLLRGFVQVVESQNALHVQGPIAQSVTMDLE